MICSIHQPNYWPWMGYFDKIIKSDIFVIYDEAQYEKNGFINRNLIKTPNGKLWLTIPIKSKTDSLKIKNVEIANQEWQQKHIKTIKTFYRRSKNYPFLSFLLDEIYNDQKWAYLSELNIYIIKKVCDLLKIRTRIIKSSELGLDNYDIVTICQKLKVNSYLSGVSGKIYLKEKGLEQRLLNSNINILYQNYEPISYEQLYGDFISKLSILDYLFNVDIKTVNV